MTDTTEAMRAIKPLLLSAYYYSFKPTGVRSIDLILAAVARAGKAYHNTDGWNEPDLDGKTPVEKIQEAAVQAALASQTVVDADKMVDRFLSWELPADFNPDGGVSYCPYDAGHPRGNRSVVGTNLLTATQAKAMVYHLLGIGEKPDTPIADFLAAAPTADREGK